MVIALVCKLLNIISNGDAGIVNMIKQYFTEITEDEYYKID